MLFMAIKLFTVMLSVSKNVKGPFMVFKVRFIKETFKRLNPKEVEKLEEVKVLLKKVVF